jgi:regulator of RNase E activity RraA
MSEALTPAELAALRAVDTPTVCNALEVLDPSLPAEFTTLPLVCPAPETGVFVGFARTATFRASRAEPAELAGRRDRFLAYVRYVESGPTPSVAVIQDLDDPPGVGAFWGEVNTAVHAGLGCAGTITNGTVRDVELLAPGFGVLAGAVGPCHGWWRVCDVDVEVEVAGMRVRPGVLVHADRHGAVVVPVELARAVPDAARTVVERERPILEAARAEGFDAERLVAALAESDAIH